MIYEMELKTLGKKQFKSLNNSALIVFVDEKNAADEVKNLSKNFDFDIPPFQLEKLKDSKTDSVMLTPGSKPEAVFVIKIKETDKLTQDFFRNELSAVPKQLKDSNIKFLDILLPDSEKFKQLFHNDEDYFYQTFTEGILLGNYEFDKYKSEKKKNLKLNVRFYSDSPHCTKGLENAEEIIDSVFFTRDLVNEPAITLTPQELAKRVKKRFAKSSVSVKVLNKTEILKRNMNALYSVGKGSENPPLLLELHYKPKGAKKKIALVGKGVTYDSGGYSIKPTDGMVDMKADMAGAAAVVGIIDAANKLKLPVELIGVIPAVENLINGRSYKPGDIVSTASGKTIEVKNTDAEGRIILADALEYAGKKKPARIIDFATLTGACVVALGEFAAGLFSKDEETVKNLTKAGEKTFELVWPLPFRDEYKKLLDSDIADISNLGPRWGGAITAAKFLEFFVDEKISYVHLDIAGPALKNKLSHYTEKWNTGFGVRVIVEYLKSL